LELSDLLKEPKLDGVPLLVFANKQDLVNALPPDEIAVGMSLYSIRNRRWQIQACSAKTNAGIDDGMKWYSKSVILYFFLIIYIM